MVSRRGFEPLTSGTGIQCSIQLSYRDTQNETGIISDYAEENLKVLGRGKTGGGVAPPNHFIDKHASVYDTQARKELFLFLMNKS